MNSVWSNKWKKVLIWFSAYANFIAFALFGGYVILKNDDEELKKTTKVALVVTMIFAAVSAFLTLYYNFLTMSDSYSDTVAYDIYNILSKVANIGKIVVYLVFIIKEFVKKDEVKSIE